MAEGKLAGKVAIVTGASRGIGAEIAERYAAEGAKVLITARTKGKGENPMEGSLDETAQRIKDAGGTVEIETADMSQPLDREKVVAAAEGAFGTVDVLVSNAAVTWFVPVVDFQDKKFRLMFEVQVTAPFHLAQLVIPTMRKNGGGHIVNISSGAGKHPQQPYGPRSMRGGTVYGMCKAALERFSTGLAAEEFDNNIAVSALSPNQVVPTPGTIHHHLTTGDDDPNAEPSSVMAAAALELSYRPAAELTGRIAYSQDLLNELGIAFK
jgi:NAD(P)-dependent dehydrogenase (short-subunit alcohol dehydrogenase family)